MGATEVRGSKIREVAMNGSGRIAIRRSSPNGLGYAILFCFGGTARELSIHRMVLRPLRCVMVLQPFRCVMVLRPFRCVMVLRPFRCVIEGPSRPLAASSGNPRQQTSLTGGFSEMR